VLLYLGVHAPARLREPPPAQVIQLGKWIGGGLVAAVALYLLAAPPAANAFEALSAGATIRALARAVASLHNANGPSSPGKLRRSRPLAAHEPRPRFRCHGRRGAAGLRRGARLSECGRDDLLALPPELRRVQDPEAGELLEAYSIALIPTGAEPHRPRSEARSTSSAAMNAPRRLSHPRPRARADDAGDPRAHRR